MSWPPFDSIPGPAQLTFTLTTIPFGSWTNLGSAALIDGINGSGEWSAPITSQFLDDINAGGAIGLMVHNDRYHGMSADDPILFLASPANPVRLPAAVGGGLLLLGIVVVQKVHP